jgi:hypothetical protein
MNSRFQVKEMNDSFICRYVVIDTRHHPVNFTEVSFEAVEDDFVSLFDIYEEAVAHAEFCNLPH